MSRFVTTGRAVTLDDGSPVKDYFIRDKETGTEILAENQNNGYFRTDIGETELTATIKQIKEHFTIWLESDNDEVQRERQDEPERGKGVWDCCHPAAIVIELLAAIPAGRLDGPDGRILQSVINRTLDNYGYSDASGGADYDAARREIDIWVAAESDNRGQNSSQNGNRREA